MTGRRRPCGRGGFSLVELLLAIAILAIGVISVAALLPAGIYQQRQASEDVVGPLAAENALALLRTRVRPEDFGAVAPFFGVQGDWQWLRPGFIFDVPAGFDFLTPGTIDLFNATGAATAWETVVDIDGNPAFPWDWVPGDPPYSGIPYNRFEYGLDRPRVLITQEERYYPLGRDVAPELVWECMFRRIGGRIEVAIFVYRATEVGAGPIRYVVQANPSNPGVPPLPIALDLTLFSGAWNSYGLDPVRRDDDAFATGTQPGDPFDLDDDRYAWQLPGQIILDQHGGVNRVLVGRQRRVEDGPVEFVRPVPPRLFADITPAFFDPVAFYNPADPTIPGPDLYVNQGVVSRIWYLPQRDGRERRLTPVYVVVKEL